MRRFYWYKTCPVCSGQGRLLVFKNLSDNHLYLHCEECEWGWDHPELADSAQTGFLTIDRDFEAIEATIEDIRRFGWEKFALEVFEEDMD